MIRVALDEINTSLKADYQTEDVYIRFEREVMTNAQDNAQIELLNAQRQGQLINNLMTAAQDLDQETVLRALCEILELDYEEVKEKLDEMNEDKKTRQAEEALNRLVPDDGGGDIGE